MKQILVWTEYRGVYAGEVPDDQDLNSRQMPLFNARAAIYWGTTNGIMQLAETGPTEKSKISAKADISMLHGIIAVFAISPEAWEKWQKQ